MRLPHFFLVFPLCGILPFAPLALIAVPCERVSALSLDDADPNQDMGRDDYDSVSGGWDRDGSDPGFPNPNPDGDEDPPRMIAPINGMPPLNHGGGRNQAPDSKSIRDFKNEWAMMSPDLKASALEAVVIGEVLAGNWDEAREIALEGASYALSAMYANKGDSLTLERYREIYETLDLFAYGGQLYFSGAEIVEGGILYGENQCPLTPGDDCVRIFVSVDEMKLIIEAQEARIILDPGEVRVEPTGQPSTGNDDNGWCCRLQDSDRVELKFQSEEGTTDDIGTDGDWGGDWNWGGDWWWDGDPSGGNDDGGGDWGGGDDGGDWG